jgi:hypothetical protein
VLREHQKFIDSSQHAGGVGMGLNICMLNRTAPEFELRRWDAGALEYVMIRIL